MKVEVHLMTLVISGLQEFIAKMRSSCSLGPVRTELAVRTFHSAVACEKKSSGDLPTYTKTEKA